MDVVVSGLFVKRVQMVSGIEISFNNVKKPLIIENVK